MLGMLIVLVCVGSVGCEEAAEPQSLCERIVEIKTLPFKGEPVDDDAYNLLRKSETEAPVSKQTHRGRS